MTDPVYYIILNLRIPSGFVECGRFLLGGNSRFANKLFDELSGDPNVTEEDMMQMELAEVRNGLPVNLNMLTCTLDEVTANCRLITREIFKLLNIER